MSRSSAIIKFPSEYIPNIFSPSIEEEFVAAAAAAATRSSWMVLSLVEFFSNLELCNTAWGFATLSRGNSLPPTRENLPTSPLTLVHSILLDGIIELSLKGSLGILQNFLCCTINSCYLCFSLAYS
jgi:hypothetical protein